MALPTKEKTWQYVVNLVTGNQGSAVLSVQEALFQIMTALLGFGSNAWTCIGSSDAVSSAMDGTNYWTVRTKIIGAVGAHSWIVLQQAGINPKFQLCIDCNYNTVAIGGTVVVSPIAGFGVANGGTDGDNSNRPTATDEVVCHNSSSWFTAGTENTHHTHIMQSEDGECTRIFFGGNDFMNQFALFDKPKNPSANWANPAVFFWRWINYYNTDVAKYQYFSDAAAARARINGTSCTFHLSTIAAINEMNGEDINSMNEVESAYEIYPIWLYTKQPGCKGIQGELYDLWWGEEQRSTPDTYPADTSRTHVQVKHIVHPWNGSVPLFT